MRSLDDILSGVLPKVPADLKSGKRPGYTVKRKMKEVKTFEVKDFDTIQGIDE